MLNIIVMLINMNRNLSFPQAGYLHVDICRSPCVLCIGDAV